MNIRKGDFFDRHLKQLAGQRAKVYVYDLIRLSNAIAWPVHFLKKKCGLFDNRKVNLGCGATCLREWINCDGNPLRRKNLWLDLRSRWPFSDSSIEGVVAAHVIEHFFDEELDHFFCELQRVLKPGAFVHLEVPSLELSVAKYLEDRDSDKFNLGVHWHGAHHQIFDFHRLSHFLVRHGFHELSSFVGKKGSSFLSDGELDEVCLRPEETLIVEAVRV